MASHSIGEGKTKNVSVIFNITRGEYDTEGENGPSRRALRARQKLSRRKDRFLHPLAKHIIKQCIDREVGRIAIGDLSRIREDENGDSRNGGWREQEAPREGV